MLDCTSQHHFSLCLAHAMPPSLFFSPQKAVISTLPFPFLQVQRNTDLLHCIETRQVKLISKTLPLGKASLHQHICESQAEHKVHCVQRTSVAVAPCSQDAWKIPPLKCYVHLLPSPPTSYSNFEYVFNLSSTCFLLSLLCQTILKLRTERKAQKESSIIRKHKLARKNCKNHDNMLSLAISKRWQEYTDNVFNMAEGEKVVLYITTATDAIGIEAKWSDSI